MVDLLESDNSNGHNHYFDPYFDNKKKYVTYEISTSTGKASCYNVFKSLLLCYGYFVSYYSERLIDGDKAENIDLLIKLPVGTEVEFERLSKTKPRRISPLIMV